MINSTGDNCCDCKQFNDVLDAELDTLSGLREGVSSQNQNDVYQRAQQSNLAGLAFSGGGIRSATFGLGAIQALSRYGLLAKFDYLSTVSGGGFIGGWLSALLHRMARVNGKVDQQAVTAFQPNLKTHPKDAGMDISKNTMGFPPVEHLAVRYLRRYSNYLTPKLGLSGDTLAAVSLFLRNLILIQLALISMVASVLLSIHVLATFSKELASHSVYLQWILIVGILSLFVAIWTTGRLLVENQRAEDDPKSCSRNVFTLIILPCLLSALLLSIAAAGHAAHLGFSGVRFEAAYWMASGLTLYSIAWGLGNLAAQQRRKKLEIIRDPQSRLGVSGKLVPLIVGALLGLFMYGVVYYLRQSTSAPAVNIWHAVAYWPPFFMLGMSFIVTVHMALVRDGFTELEREWFARLGGIVLLVAGAWLLLFCFVLYATPFVNWLAGGGLAAFMTWVGATGFSAKIAQSSSTDGKKEGPRWKEIVAKIAPWIFVLGLGVIVSYATHVVLMHSVLDSGYTGTPNGKFVASAKEALKQLNELPLLKTFLACAIMCIASFIISRRFDINLFSLHTLYANRLTRAYLGASAASTPTGRNPNPFSGFDPDDDLKFDQLAQQRPIHIINTAINMTGGDDLAWQTRRAASFSFTPAWAGYETQNSLGRQIGSYCPTAQYAGGLTLGELMAVSGAAASPNMGYHTSAAVSALMTALNLRLGRWCGNVSSKKYDTKCQSSPQNAFEPIKAELTGSATAQGKWINLTDGGHFENLGVYELIRRRCKLIFVIDAGCDPKHEFEDLANMLRKCWTDFGVNIRFVEDEFKKLHLQKDSRYCETHTAIGRIEYPDNSKGILVYFKNSITGTEWPDIRQYADSHKDFPHETTADQFFGEDQFEAYRHLGYKVIALFAEELEKRLSSQHGINGSSPEEIKTVLYSKHFGEL